MSTPGSTRRVLLAGTTLLLVAAAAIGWQAGRGSPSAEREAQTSASTATGLTRYARGDRPRAPEIRGETLDGGRVALTDLRGYVVVVNVWGSWCQPCRKEAPDLARAARETAPRGVRFVGIDTRDNDAAARAFVRSFNIPYPSLIDDDGRLTLAFAGVIPVSAVPSTVVIDAEGNIAARVVGIVSYGTLRGLIDDVLAESPSPQSPSTQSPSPRRAGNPRSGS